MLGDQGKMGEGKKFGIFAVEQRGKVKYQPREFNGRNGPFKVVTVSVGFKQMSDWVHAYVSLFINKADLLEIPIHEEDIVFFTGKMGCGKVKDKIVWHCWVDKLSLLDNRSEQPSSGGPYQKPSEAETVSDDIPF